jgi:hypothetical protein
MTLTAQIAYEVRQGLVFQLPLRLPPGWEVEAVEMTPTDLLRSSGVKTGKQGRLLLVDLRRPLSSGKDGRGTLTVRLRPTRSEPAIGPGMSTVVPFPDVVPLGATYREGGLAIDYDDQVHIAQVSTDSLAGESPVEGPWGKSAPALYYPCKGEAIRGTLRLRQRAPRLRARAQTEVHVVGDRPAVQTSLVLEGEGGLTSQVDVYLSAGTLPAQWRVDPAVGPGSNRLRRVERLLHLNAGAELACLAAVSPLGALALQAARPPGSFWRLTLERPLALRQPLTLRTTLAAVPVSGQLHDGRAWVVPLIVVPGSGGAIVGGQSPYPWRGESEVTIHLASARLISLVGSGLREAPAAVRPAGPPRAASAWRSFRYADPSAELTLRLRSVRADSATTTVDRARLTTVLTSEGAVRHHFCFRLLRWPQRTLPVKLPAGAWFRGAAVNGHWLEQLSRPTESEEEATLDLPVPVTTVGVDGEANHPSFEILYTTPGPHSTDPWPRLQAPPPVLPVTPAAFTRRWLLPPGVLPLSDHDVQRLPGSEESNGDTFLLARRPTDLFRLGPVLPLPGEPAQRLLACQQALTDAAAGVRSRLAPRRPGAAVPEMRLDGLVEEVAFGYLGELHPLVVDASTLSRAGLGPRTLVPMRPASASDDRGLPWEALGLIALPARAGVLLTSRAAAQRWSGGLPESIDQAMATAALAGRDPSGRFQTALEWLQPVRNRAPGATLFTEADALEGWTTWAPVAGAGPDADLRIVRRGPVAGLGLALAGLLGLALLRSRQWGAGPRMRFMLLWLGSAGVALAWLPASLRDLAWWPLLAGLTIALPWYLAWANRPRRAAAAPSSNKGQAVVSAAATAGLLLVLLLQSPGPAQSPRPEAEPVYLLHASEGQPESVLVAPALVTRLEKMAQPAAAPRRGAVLVSAAYEGKLVNGVAEFDAVFQVHALADEPATLTVPLDGIQLLGDVLLDGARVHPLALPGARGYSVPVRGAGRHKLELRFRVSAGALGELPGIQQVRFRLPSLVQSRLVFRVGPGSLHLQALVKHGSQRVVPEAGGQRLEVDLGAVLAPVHLRWYNEGKPPRMPRVEHQEAYLWDLRPDASTLTAFIRYQISGGAVTRLHLDLPANLELRSAQARRPAPSGTSPRRIEDSPGATDTGVRLSDWMVLGAPSSRVAQLDFPGPVAGVVEVTLELVPRGPWSGTVLLPIPRPHGQPTAQVPGYLAYRTQGLESTLTNFLRITAIRNEEFAPFWPAATRPTASSLTYASSFRRDPSGARQQDPELRVQLRPLAPHLHAAQEIRLRVGPRQAEVSAHIELTAANRDLSVVEWAITPAPGFVVAEVRGADVGRWCQSGSRLLVWLEKTTGSTEIDVSGFLPYALPAAGKKPTSPPRAETLLDLPCMRIAGAKGETRLTLQAEAGLRLQPQGVRGLTAQGRPSVSERRYTAREAAYGGTFLVQAGPTPVAEVRTEAALRGKELTFTATIDYRALGEVRTVTLRLRGWEGNAELEVNAGSIARRRESARGASGRLERIWSLDLAPGARDHYRLVLRGRMPLEEAAEGVSMPEVVVPGAKTNQTLVVDRSLATESCAGLTAIPPPAGAAAGAQAWKRTGEEWCMRLLPREGTRAELVQMLLMERRASVPDGRRWLHEAVFWLLHEAPAELRVSWPGPVEVVGVAIDDSPVSVVQPESGRLWLPLPGQAGIRQVRIRWRNAGDKETLEHPDLAGPVLDGAGPGATIWTLTVPPGWELLASEGHGTPSVGADRRAAVALYRARAQLTITRELLRQPRTDEKALTQAQRRFASSVWVAGLALKAGADPHHTARPGGEEIADWLEQLRRANRDLLHEHQLDELGREAERQVRQGSEQLLAAQLPVQGTPVSWLDQRAARPKLVRLVPLTQRHVRQALSFSCQWLIVLLVVWTVTLSSVLRSVLRWLWPEQMALLGVLGWQVAGPTLLVLFLLALGFSGRMLLIIRTVQVLLVRRPRSAPSGSSLRG